MSRARWRGCFGYGWSFVVIGFVGTRAQEAVSYCKELQFPSLPGIYILGSLAFHISNPPSRSLNTNKNTHSVSDRFG